MLHDIVKVYADALTVATTLHLPATPRDQRGNGRVSIGNSDPDSNLSDRRVGRIRAWWRVLLDRVRPARQAGLTRVGSRSGALPALPPQSSFGRAPTLWRAGL